MKTKKQLFTGKILLIFLTFFFISNVYSQEYTRLPSKIQIAFMLKILEFNKTIFNSKKDISIHIINDDYIYEELQKLIGMKIQNKEIKKITQSVDGSLPSYTPSIIYIGNVENVDPITEFTQAKQVLSVTGNPDLIKKGITISIAVLSGTPNIILNSISSDKENMKWDAKMNQISTVIK